MFLLYINRTTMIVCGYSHICIVHSILTQSISCIPTMIVSHPQPPILKRCLVPLSYEASLKITVSLLVMLTCTANF